MLNQLDVFSPYPVLYPLVMQKEEKKLFDKYVKNSKYYLEFGIGGSTFRVLQKSKAMVDSVDNDLAWINQISKYLYIKKHKKERLRFHYSFIGKIKGWGYPEKKKLKHLFPDYSSKIFNSILKKNIDVIFIDGRFRVACTLQAILNCSVNKNLFILIHDFWTRKEYHLVLKYLNEIESKSSLGVFTIKKNLNLRSLKKDYQKYKFNLF